MRRNGVVNEPSREALRSIIKRAAFGNGEKGSLNSVDEILKALRDY